MTELSNTYISCATGKMYLLIYILDERYFAFHNVWLNSEVPTFAKEIENATVPVGREATLSCVIYNLGNFKVRFSCEKSLM